MPILYIKTATGQAEIAGGSTGNVTAAAVIADNAIVRGDGGGRGVQGSGWLLNDSDLLTAAGNLNMDSNDITKIRTIQDANLNELISFKPSASAVNQIRIHNAATGDAAKISVAGETNVGLDLSDKGDGSDSGIKFFVDGDVTDVEALRLQKPSSIFATVQVEVNPGDSADVDFVVNTTTAGFLTVNSGTQRVQIGASAEAALLSLESVATGDPNLICKLIAAQTGDFIQLVDENDVEKFAIGPAGNIDTVGTIAGHIIGADIQAFDSGIYTSGGTDVAVADGGTGSSTASGARVNLGLVIGTDVLGELADDPSPELAANLDVEGFAFVDDSGNEILMFSAVGTPVNEFTILNAAAGSGPILRATGSETNIDLILEPKGTGDIRLGGSLNMLVDPGSSGGGTIYSGSDTQIAGFMSGSGAASLGGRMFFFPRSAASNAGNVFFAHGSRFHANTAGNFLEIREEDNAVVAEWRFTDSHHMEAQADDYYVKWGTAQDCGITFDGTSMLLNPDLLAAGAELQLDSASCWTANGVVAVTLTSLGPAGIGTTTVGKWLTVKDNAGTTYYIPAWT